MPFPLGNRWRLGPNASAFSHAFLGDVGRSLKPFPSLKSVGEPFTAAQSCIDIPRELRNTCPVRDFQTPSKPVALKRYIDIRLSISERNGSSNVRMYQCFGDKGTFEEKRTQWLLPTLPPPYGYRRLVHHALPHKVHLTCLPLLQDNSASGRPYPPALAYRRTYHTQGGAHKSS